MNRKQSKIQKNPGVQKKYIENNKDISITILYNKSYYKKSELETAA